MATINTLVARSRRMLRGSKREPFRLIKTAVPAADTFLDVTAAIAGKVAVDDYLGVGAEIMAVTSVDTSLNRIDVIRGVDDTPIPASHPVATRVEINWRWFTADLVAWLADEIRSWGDGIYKPNPVSLSLGVASRSVDLPLTRFRHPLTLRQKVSTREWVDVPAGRFRVETGLPTSEFPSGNTLILSGAKQTSQLIFTYAQGFDLAGVETVTTDLSTIGITETLYDVALHGIAWRALAGDEASRLDDGSQPEPRAADEIDAFDNMRAASAYKAIRDLRLEEEKRRLRTLYPVKVA